MPFTRTALGALDLNLISALVVLIEERSTTRAAARLGLAQSTVSGTLARLREITGDELLVRQGRGLAPTPRAEALLAAARPHLEALIAAIGTVTPFDPAEDARTFRLGCTDAVALALLPTLSRTIRAEAPHCDLVIRIGDYRSLPGMLSTGEISTALAYMRDDPPALARIKVVRRSPWHVLRDADSDPVPDIDAYCARPHVLVTPSGDLSGFADEGLGGRTRRIVAGLPGFALLPSVLRGSDVVSTVPDFVARALTADGTLAAEPCPVDIAPVVNRMAWRQTGHADPAEAWFRTQVEAAFH
ncbi:MAG: LysR family transcriptional regulator [Pseudomonadota bacterium]